MTRQESTAPVSHGAPAPDAPEELTPTPGQTIGPFFGYATAYEQQGLPFGRGNELVPPGRADAVRLTGVVYDGAGEPIPDALVEIWQLDENGHVPEETGSLVRDGWTFTGWGRDFVDREGRYTFSTVNPGPAAGVHPAFFSMVVFARGLLNRLFTRVYLPEDEKALAEDPLLASLAPERRRTLVARRAEDGGLHFDIRLQGQDETVFLTFPGIED